VLAGLEKFLNKELAKMTGSLPSVRGWSFSNELTMTYTNDGDSLEMTDGRHIEVVNRSIVKCFQVEVNEVSWS
jgi:hypothetical protein